MSLNLTAVSTFKNLTYKPSTDQWLLNKIEIQLSEFAINLDSLKTGWGFLAPGMAPDWTWDTITGQPDPQPTPEHKRAFSIELIDPLNGTMEWNGTGHGSCKAIEKIFEDINKSKSEHPKKIPICKYLHSEAEKIGKGNTRVPIFNIIGWSYPDGLPWLTSNDDDLGDKSVSQGIVDPNSVDEEIPF